MLTIKEIRQLIDMTQKEFGEYLNIPIRTLEDWERGVRNPPIYVIELINYKIKKEIKIMENAINEFNNWQGKAKIMIDLEDFEIWTDVFDNDNSWKEYHSPYVKMIVAKDNLYGRNNKVTKEELASKIARIKELVKESDLDDIIYSDALFDIVTDDSFNR